MKRKLWLAVGAVVLSGLAALSGAAAVAWAQDAEETASPAAARTVLAHDLFFQLKDNSPEAREKLIEACKKYLSQHPGLIYFAVGTPSDIKGLFNVTDYDVALHMAFEDKAALSAYAKTSEHQQFIAEMTANMKGLRIFDSFVEVAPNSK